MKVFTLIFALSFLLVTPSFAKRCVLSGEGYASNNPIPLQKIYDLSVSVSSSDRECLSQVIQEYLAQGLIFRPKAGSIVEYAWAPEKGIANVYPIGSTTGYWVIKENLLNCR